MLIKYLLIGLISIQLFAPVSTPPPSPMKVTPKKSPATKLLTKLQESPFDRLMAGTPLTPKTDAAINKIAIEASRLPDNTPQKRKQSIFRKLLDAAAQEHSPAGGGLDEMRTSEDAINSFVASPPYKKGLFNALRNDAKEPLLIDWPHFEGRDTHSSGGGHNYDRKPAEVDALTLAKTGITPKKDRRGLVSGKFKTSPQKPAVGPKPKTKIKDTSMVTGLSYEDIDREMRSGRVIAYKIDPVTGIVKELRQGQNGRYWESTIKPDDQLMRPYPVLMVEEGFGFGTDVYGTFYPFAQLKQFADQARAGGRKDKFPGIVNIAPETSGNKDGVYFKYR